MCTQHSHNGEEQRCRCCDPAARRARRRRDRMQERGHEGEIDDEFAAGSVTERTVMAADHQEATHDPSPTVRTARARAAGLTDDEQDRLAGDEHPRVRAALAGNAETSPATLDALSSDDDRRVREAVAKHPNTPPEALEHMAGNLDRRRDLRVARAIAQHPATSDEVLEGLMERGTGGWRAIAKSALRDRAEQAAGDVLTGAERLGTGMEAGVSTSADPLEEALGLEPRREAKVG